MNWRVRYAQLDGRRNYRSHTPGLHGGPVIRVGRTRVNDNITEYDYPGTVIQNGATTKIWLPYPESKLNIGDSGTTPNPISSYTLTSGTIGMAIGGASASRELTATTASMSKMALSR